MYDTSTNEGLSIEQDGSVTRGYEERIVKPRPRLDIRKHSWSNRVVNSYSVLDFERKLDRVWKNQKLKFDYTAMLESKCLEHNEYLTTEPSISNLELELQSQ